VISAEQARLLSMPADQRQAVREEIASEQRARREAERLERIDRSRTRSGAPRPTIGIDGTIRAAAEPEPVEIRGSTSATAAGRRDARGGAGSGPASRQGHRAALRAARRHAVPSERRVTPGMVPPLRRAPH
jgi:hypothetical protein